MFKKIIDLILSFFKDSSKDKTNNKKTESRNQNGKSNYRKSNQQTPAKKGVVPITIIKKEAVLLKIEENLQFIDDLIEALEAKGDYKIHIKKLKDLKVQSYACTKLIKRISENAPYYQNTLKLVNKHTNEVRELMTLV